MRSAYIFIASLGIFILVLIIATFIEVGSPLSKKALILDQERMSDFSSISYEIDYYYENNNKLLDKLSDLKRDNAEFILDPETKKPYDYKKVSDNTYQLCAVFSTDSIEVKSKNKNNTYYDTYGYSSEKNHKKGYDCINYKVNYSSSSSDLYLDSTPTIISTIAPTPTSLAEEAEILQINPNYKWRSPTYEADITISQAYLTNSKIENVESSESQDLLFIQLTISNKKTSVPVYPKQLLTLIADRDAGGTLTYPLMFEGFNGSPINATKVYGVFVPPANKIFFELNTDENKAVYLDFTNAKKAKGKLDLNKGFTAE